MQISKERRAAVKPAVWGAIGGAIAAIAVGFAWGGWVTGATAGKMAATSAEEAVVLAFTPLCVARAEQQPEQILRLKEERSWNYRDFVVNAGWVGNVTERYQAAVANSCATTLVEAAKTKPAG